MPSPDRHLAAILSADVVGYSRLMAEDEDATIRAVTARREEVELHVRQHRGRLNDFTGDNFLAEFGSAVAALDCAVEIQRLVAALNAALAPERKMEFRIGLHLGEVRVQDDRLFGTGVNVAARLESLAEPGGICISGEVYGQVESRLDLGYEDLGEQSVKNIPKPVRVYRVRLDAKRPDGVRRASSQDSVGAIPPGQSRIDYVIIGLLVVAIGWMIFTSQQSGQEPKEQVEPVAALTDTSAQEEAHPEVLHNSIAVLPFDNLSPNPDDAYFAAGIHEEVINQLVGIRDLSVISRTSVMQYAGVHKPIKDIARELGVGAVMEGSVRYAGNRVRITAQLIDGKSGAHLWSKAYEDSLEDIFGIQLAIATQIAGTLEAEFSPAERSRIGTRATENADAYASYIRAKSAFGNYSPTGPLHEALDTAIELDPQFAEALAFKAFVYSIEATAGGAFFGSEFGRDDQQRFVSLSVEYANRALEIDSQQARAHYALRWAHTINREWEASQRSAARAYELSPNDYVVLNSSAWDALARGDVDGAIDLMERSMAIVPGDFANQGNFAVLLRYAQRWDYAERQGLFVAKLVPDFAFAYLGLAATLAYSGDVEGARANAAIVEAKQPNEYAMSVIAFVYRRIGDIKDAERLFNQWHPAGVPISTHPRIQYNWHAAVGNTEAAIEQLEKALDQGFPWDYGRNLHYHSKHPYFDPVRAHPKFEELVRRAALPLAKSE